MIQDWIADCRRRAAQGDAEATAFTAVLAGVGSGEPRSWANALERLNRAAEAGSEAARGQLAVLAADGGPAALTDWLAPATKRRLRPEPRISVLETCVSPAACRWLIGRAEGRVRAAQVFDPATGAARQEATRGNSAFTFAFEDLDLILLLVRERLAASMGIPVVALEPAQMLHYAPGQSFERHFDFLDPEVPAYAAEIERGGQRLATALIYLNDDYTGGETDFPLVGLRHKGRLGEALMFANILPTGAPDRQTLHAGLATTAGEKWVFSQWVRDRAAI